MKIQWITIVAHFDSKETLCLILLDKGYTDRKTLRTTELFRK